MRPEGFPCRGCLGSLGRRSQAGLCGRCWSGLVPLAEERCLTCALSHPWKDACPEPVAWVWGDALWDYHAGRPALGSLLVPGIKRGELGWKAALLGRLREAPLPDFAAEVHGVCCAPTGRLRRWSRGFDLAEEAAALVAERLKKPLELLLRKPWFARAQAGLPEGARRRQGGRVSMIGNRRLSGEILLLVDDVWTTGTTLLGCARTLSRAGAGEVRVLSLFRAGKRA